MVGRETYHFLNNVDVMCEPLQVFLETIGIAESGLDGKTVNKTYCFYKRLINFTLFR